MDTDRLRNRPVIILDTNALFFPFIYNIDISQAISELFGNTGEIFVPKSVLRELDILIEKKEKYSQAAKEYAKRFKIIENPGTGDDTIFELVLSLDAILVTGDRELKERLKASGKSVICPRGKNRLMLDV